MQCLHYYRLASSPATVNFLRCLLSWRVMMTMTTQSTTRRRMRRTAAPPTAPPTTVMLMALELEAAVTAFVVEITIPESVHIEQIG